MLPLTIDAKGELNNVYKFCSYLKEKSKRLHHKDQLVNTVEGK
jgi:hypothetical protein